MASIIKFSCDRCEYIREGSDGEIYVVCEDASEVLCWHPGEDYTAKKATGCEWEQLKEADRFRNRGSYLCLQCGEYGMYGWHKGQAEGVIGPYINHVPAQEVHRNSVLRCAACEQKRLYSFNGRLGTAGCLPLLLPFVALANLSKGAIAWYGLGASLLFIVILWDLPGLRFLRPVCPQCRRGRLRRQMTGKS